MIMLRLEEVEAQEAQNEDSGEDEELSDKEFFRPDRTARRRAMLDRMRKSHGG